MVYHRIFSFGGGGGGSLGGRVSERLRVPMVTTQDIEKIRGGGGIRGVIQISIKHSLRQDSRVVLSYPS